MKSPVYLAFILQRGSTMSDVQQRIDELVKSNRVVLFMKGTAQFPMCGFSGRAVQILKACGVDDLKTVNVLEDEEIRQGIKDYAKWPTIPQLYVNGEFVGGSDIMMEMYQAGELQQALGTPPKPDRVRRLPRAWSSASPAPPARSTACGCSSGCARPGARRISSSRRPACSTSTTSSAWTASALEALADDAYSPADIGACIASGSFATDAMVVAPCSMKTLAAVAHGLSDNLLTRAADVMLKERRRLVLMVRETPLNLAHLRNMTAVTEMGAIVFPPLPAFYHRPQSIDEIVDDTVERALALLGIDGAAPQALAGPVAREPQRSGRRRTPSPCARRTPAFGYSGRPRLPL